MDSPDALSDPEVAASPPAAPSPTPFINQTLSRGLAYRAVSVLAAQGDRYRAGLAPIFRRRFRSKKTVTQVVARLERLGERCRLIQVIGRTPNGRLVSVCPFVPVRLFPEDHRRRGIVGFDLYQLVVSVRGALPGPDWGPQLAASEHAIERLFLRLNTLDLGAVSEELHDAVLLAIPAVIAGRALGLRQLALPTSSGAFLCDLTADRGQVIAKTWLSDCALGTRWNLVVAQVRDAVLATGGVETVAGFLAMGMDGPLAGQPHALVEALQQALAPFGWLREEYTPRPDPVGTTWTNAREAANSEDAAA
jgi:hypothetical protein